LKNKHWGSLWHTATLVTSIDMVGITSAH
jgi:hypothetical protein